MGTHSTPPPRLVGLTWGVMPGTSLEGRRIIFIYNINNYPYVCPSMFENSRSQFLLDRLGRCLKLFVSTDITSCHEFASQFGLAIFLYAKNTQNLVETESPVQVFI